eukprot:CAMPEP_0194265840 /NCGR_PEP_ID=MMETSP0169-20130528/943_1 /TAXON_ID=218684 /ORGANISM="Corethron pennatum, Strain L29A3" /LENGTH=314 /DNA_ID=CAMNT_0039006393 /DNA_START=34 /DNA_END=979 /DNA_ORIENTATION=+
MPMLRHLCVGLFLLQIATAADVVYEKIHSSTCENFDWITITSNEECAAAAEYFAATFTDAAVRASGSSKYLPTGCLRYVYHYGDHQTLRMVKAGTGNCGYRGVTCYCKRISGPIPQTTLRAFDTTSSPTICPPSEPYCFNQEKGTKCGHPIVDPADCTRAAKFLGLTGSKTAELSSYTYPVGCVYDYAFYEKVFVTPLDHTAGAPTCDDGRHRCLCRGPQVWDPATAPVPMRASRTTYRAITSKICEDHGYAPITTDGECTAAADFLGGTYGAVRKSASSSTFPPGCNRYVYHHGMYRELYLTDRAPGRVAMQA